MENFIFCAVYNKLELKLKLENFSSLIISIMLPKIFYFLILPKLHLGNWPRNSYIINISSGNFVWLKPCSTKNYIKKLFIG